MSKQRVDFGEKIVLKVATAAEPPKEAAGELRVGDLAEKVSLSSRCARGTYLALKEAEHWMPGFVMEEFIEAAIKEKLANLPADYRQPLPPARLAHMLNVNKKLRAGT